jgi:acyl-CoA hydrolase
MSNHKPAKDSFVEMNNIVLPSHANARGTVFGGTMMSWIDIAAAICATRHAREICVTASIDTLNFLAPAVIGNNVNLKAHVVYTGKTSLVISVDAFAEDMLSGKRHKCSTARLTFVALDKNHKSTPVPPLLLETEEQKKEFEKVEKRRKELLKNQMLGL